MGASNAGFCALGVAATLMLAGCGGDSFAPPPDFAGIYPGSFTARAASTVPPDSRSESSLIYLKLAHRTDGNYDLSVILRQAMATGGGPVWVVGISAAGAMSFPNFDQSTVLSSLDWWFTGGCSNTGAVATISGSVQGTTATFQIIVTGKICDWDAGSETPDLRPTTVTQIWQGTKQMTAVCSHGTVWSLGE